MSTVSPSRLANGHHSAITADRTHAEPAVRTAPPTASAPQVGLPSIHTRFVFTWAAVYSALIVVQLLIGPMVLTLPLPLRTLIITGFVVPAVVYGLVPTLLKGRATVIRRGSR